MCPQQKTDKGGDKLGQLDGTFAVIVFDKLCGRVMVARDPSGAEPLYWGTVGRRCKLDP